MEHGRKTRSNTTTRKPAWKGEGGHLHQYIERENKRTLSAYRSKPDYILEHANIEDDITRGGYAYRQIYELVQNSADAIFGSGRGRIAVRLTDRYLYCADDGKPLDQEGIRSLNSAHLSPKRNTEEIGRFGLGFKSVLGVTDRPEFFTRGGSFYFDRDESRKKIRRVKKSKRYPVLRLAFPFDQNKKRRGDAVLVQLMKWATNIVRLPLLDGVHADLANQIRRFPSEFLLFVDHVEHIELDDGNESRKLSLASDCGIWTLKIGEETTRWKVFSCRHSLSQKALRDRRSTDDSSDVKVTWAAPLQNLNEPGKFWCFFPTQTSSLLAGILNAPWKTNEDRQNLLTGAYNDELIEAAVRLVAKNLSEISEPNDPARHLDALPRRHESGDSHQSELLRRKLDYALGRSRIAPDQTGTLQQVKKLKRTPGGVSDEAIKIWESAARRPKLWLHHSALSPQRLAKLDRLVEAKDSTVIERAIVSEWLEALIDNSKNLKASLESSKIAIQVAASLAYDGSFGKIVLTQAETWVEPEEFNVFLPDQDGNPADYPTLTIHQNIVSDKQTREALKRIGITTMALEDHLRNIVTSVLSDQTVDPNKWDELWGITRKLKVAKSKQIIDESDIAKRKRIKVRTLSGEWVQISNALLPKPNANVIDPVDKSVFVDDDYHEPDLQLLRQLGVVDKPIPDYDLSQDEYFQDYLNEHRERFKERDLKRNPRENMLNFNSCIGSGPISPITLLSDQEKAWYTGELLDLERTYKKWEMRHDSQDDYQPLRCDSPAIDAIRRFGHLRQGSQIVKVEDALGPPGVRNEKALHSLLRHSKAFHIKKALELSEPEIDPIDEEDPIPLLDVWPGLETFLQNEQNTYTLIRCDQIVEDNVIHCVRSGTVVYIVNSEDERGNLEAVCEELGLEIQSDELTGILNDSVSTRIDERRAEIKEGSSDEERLALAVGAEKLLEGLPDGLVAILEEKSESSDAKELARAAIATYHTFALRHYRTALDDNGLAPPKNWAGSKRAINFVNSIGFKDEWAGKRKERKESSFEVVGHQKLPPLHDFQEAIAKKVQAMLLESERNQGRRALISLPTGSGKTRVAVEAVINAINANFKGAVLWVADRDELCEQAVVAWTQVWSSIGEENSTLLISRMWGGNPSPIPKSERHVVISTVQTLASRLERRPENHDFLRDFDLVVFDEAHRSVTPIHTKVMNEIGLKRRSNQREPFLLGLTATPYRGHDERETARLANRYSKTRFDHGVFDRDDPIYVIQELQNRKILAFADHQEIEGGGYELSDEELKEYEKIPNSPWLPQSVENRIARDTSRTQNIISAYERWVRPTMDPTLIFATSVDHAMTISALLQRLGVESRAVSSSTEVGTRQQIVNDFRDGKIKALVNYAVFREGFDAPKTRVIIIARPVFSPNLYFQMIGRGLRGPANGGNEECLIINVRDNIKNFDRQLAFSELDWLWNK